MVDVGRLLLSLCCLKRAPFSVAWPYKSRPAGMLVVWCRDAAFQRKRGMFRIVACDLHVVTEVSSSSAPIPDAEIP